MTTNALFRCRGWLVSALAAVLGTMMTIAGGACDEPARPNILLIVSDDQGYNDLSCLDSSQYIETPHLDRLAAEGVRLTDFYVTWPACTPSRGSLLTGRYPQRNGTYDMFRNDVVDFGVEIEPERYAVSWERVGGMDTREVLLAELLGEAGYYSGIFGKWDLGQLKRYLPTSRGFDEYYGFANTGIDYFTHERYGVPSMFRGTTPTDEDRGTYFTDLIEREALRFVEENHDRPFFLYLPFNAPHSASNLDKAIRMAAQAPPEEIARVVERFPELAGDERWAIKRRRYAASIARMDRTIGRVLESLARHDLERRTLVIFLSDNGGGTGSDNAPLRAGKGRMFEGGIRVPCIVRWPGRLPRGRVCDELLTALEVFPTVLGAVEVASPDGVVLDGFDMMPVLRGEEPSPRQEMFWQRRGDKAARVGHWKWVDSSAGRGLFDLSTDIAEENDLSATHPEVLKRVKSRFTAWQLEMEAAEPRGPFRDY